jgi:glycosyltransferase involved in cell wall biosynthesis
LRRVVTNSRFVVENDLSRFKGFRGKVCVIGNGVDVDFINGVNPLDLEGDPSIVFVGHLVYRKGIDVLLRALRVLCPRVEFKVKLHVVGSGVMERECREYVLRHDLDDKVRFWGSVDELLKFRILKGADVLVLPSRYENLPVALLEGMAAGKAIVATRVGGVSEIFKNGVNGLLTVPSSVNIADALRLLCENKHLINEYSENNVRAALSFDWKNIVESYVKLYQSVLR